MHFLLLFSFIEDFYRINDFTDAEIKDLKIAIFCEELPTSSEYEAHMAGAGFSTQVIIIDYTILHQKAIIR